MDNPTLWWKSTVGPLSNMNNWLLFLRTMSIKVPNKQMEIIKEMKIKLKNKQKNNRRSEKMHRRMDCSHICKGVL